MMTGNQTSHITVTYWEGLAHITRVYSVNQEILTKLEGNKDWQGRHIKLTGKDLHSWLDKQGCRLDSLDGPAYVQRHANYNLETRYYSDGKLHREDGPAVIMEYANGPTKEKYYRHGELIKEDSRARPKSRLEQLADAGEWIAEIDRRAAAGERIVVKPPGPG